MNLNELSTKELMDLNAEIMRILRTRRKDLVSARLAEFRPGDHVEFTHGSDLIRGYVTRINTKTISVESYEPQGRWRVAPVMLRRLADADEGNSPANLLPSNSLFPDSGAGDFWAH